MSLLSRSRRAPPSEYTKDYYKPSPQTTPPAPSLPPNQKPPKAPAVPPRQPGEVRNIIILISKHKIIYL